MTIARGRGDQFLLKSRKIARIPVNALDRAGEQMSFYARAIAWTRAPCIGTGRRRFDYSPK